MLETECWGLEEDEMRNKYASWENYDRLHIRLREADPSNHWSYILSERYLKRPLVFEAPH